MFRFNIKIPFYNQRFPAKYKFKYGYNKAILLKLFTKRIAIQTRPVKINVINDRNFCTIC